MSTAFKPRIGPAHWLRVNLFSSLGNTLLTVLVVALLAWLLPKALGWLVFNAVWGRQPIAACDAVRGSGACWAVVWEKFRFMFFGTYPYAEQWRGALAILALCSLLVLSTWRVLWNWSLVLIWVTGIALTFWQPWLGVALYTIVALIWLVPDRRIERTLSDR